MQFLRRDDPRVRCRDGSPGALDLPVSAPGGIRPTMRGAEPESEDASPTVGVAGSTRR